jgi:flavin reductase (DIM6/NTAB) family NADH-FMN oxidoreductase RutF
MSGSAISGEVTAALKRLRAAMRLLASGVALVTTLDGAVCLAALR